jgi:glutamate N-acetyltransferase/amino-acid N-acetyltransferase
VTPPTLQATWGPTDRSSLVPIAGGGVTAPPGFRAGATAAGLKPSGRPDVAVVVADRQATVAVSTTTNRVRAACCDVAVEHARDGRGRAVVVNAGNANACVPDGRAHAEQTCDRAAAGLGGEAADVIPMSTGVIGVPMPIDRLLAGVPAALDDATGDMAGGQRAAEAILTTDLVAKQVAYHVIDEHGRCTIGAMAKGSGMIEPAMATMLGVVTTDAPVPAAVLRTMLKQAVRRSFNRVSVDACGSTNDTVAVLASGAASQPPGLTALQAGLEAVCADLAAMGASEVAFDPARVSVTCGGVTVCRFGVAASFDPGQAAAAMQRDTVDIAVDLAMGDHAATFLVGDLSRDYVTINADYTT